MTTSMHLTLHPWLHLWAEVGVDDPDHDHLDQIHTVSFHEHVDLDLATVGPGTGFLRIDADDWRALGFPKEVTVTISKRKDETDARSDGG